MLEQLQNDVRHHDVPWNDPKLRRMLIIRLVRDDESYLVTYAVGLMADGYLATVALPFKRLSKRVWKTEIIEHARSSEVFAKELGVFQACSLLKVPVENTAEMETGDESSE